MAFKDWFEIVHIPVPQIPSEIQHEIQRKNLPKKIIFKTLLLKNNDVWPMKTPNFEG